MPHSPWNNIPMSSKRLPLTLKQVLILSNSDFRFNRRPRKGLNKTCYFLFVIKILKEVLNALYFKYRIKIQETAVFSLTNKNKKIYTYMYLYFY